MVLCTRPQHIPGHWGCLWSDPIKCLFILFWRSRKESERMDAFGVQINIKANRWCFFSQPYRVSLTSRKVRVWRRLPAVTSCDDRTTHSAPLSFNFLLSPKQYSANMRFSCAPVRTGRCFAINGRSCHSSRLSWARTRSLCRRSSSLHFAP